MNNEILAYYNLESQYYADKDKALRIAVRKVYKPSGTLHEKINQYEIKFNEIKKLLNHTPKQLNLFDLIDE